jgi:Ca-activated chloride channel homolog
MKFLWPNMLFMLLALPLLVMLYFWLINKRKKNTIGFGDFALLKAASQKTSGWRRHVPPALFFFSLGLMLFALARPTAVVTLPSQNQTIMMAMDVSGSMRAKDVEPNRLAASQAAAKKFIANVPVSTRIGLVTFAGSAALVQPPTRERQELIDAIDRFTLQRGTAVGNGLLVSLKTLFPDLEINVKGFTSTAPDSKSAFPGGSSTDNRDKALLGAAAQSKADKSAPAPVPAGSYESAVIILLTDGQTTTGADPSEAAKFVADRGVKVYTVGFGTQNGEIIGFEGWSMRVRLDEEALKQIAGTTRGEYFYAGSAVDLDRVYQTLNSRLVFEKKETEVTALVTAAAAALALLAAGFSLFWFNRVL